MMTDYENELKIGPRAIEIMLEREGKTGQGVREQLKELSMSRRNQYAWQSEGRIPGGVALARMAAAGYDVMYILTGRRTL